jgi:Zn-dependent peptidase ImmA (M78 family)
VPGPFGAWLAAKDADYILYQQETSKAHQDHIIVHELSHMLAEHASDEGDDDLLVSLYPDLAPDAVRQALRRPGYGDQHEREAETVATIILEWASVLNQVQPVTAALASSAADCRLDEALGDRLGWL